MEELHDRAEGGAGLLHNIYPAKTMVLRGAHVSEDVFEEDAQPLKRVEVKETRVEGALAGGYTRASAE